jgi:trehalose 6-phosphate phosphatase
LRLPDSIFLENFWSALAAVPRAALLLDYDGTLAPFHIDPARARPYPGVEALLNRIGRLPNDRLVIVSGRWLQDLRPLLTLEFEPEMWGCHGREQRLPDGRHSLAPLSEAAVQTLAEADGWAATICALGGRVERKPGSLAFHWRGLAPGHQRSLGRDLETRFAALAPAGELLWHEFDGGIELRAAGCDKGQVVSQVLAEQDAVQAGCVAYLGDDHTDEDAFRALQGRGLRVLVRPKWRTTAADVWLRPPDGLREFLGRWADIREGNR